MRNTIISVVVMFAFFAFYQLYYFINPFRKRVDQYYNSFFYYKDLKRSVKGLVLLILLISGVSTVYMWSKLFHKISSLNMKDAGEYVYAFFPDQFIFAFPAFFMGILTTTIIIDFFFESFLKKILLGNY
ncbi:hypothetical protein B9R14_07605 [Acetivibrio saccincola]|uniref:Uncharacterized protein n=1 Tax=Acetivibrio saccincola TaxID=1677857 RepID=A0A2S8R9Z5_9FIRM|nr:hypothetical protein B9R14_07605 [Acetivibrio saccincola]